MYHYAGCGHCKYCLSGNIMLCNDKRALGWNMHGANAKYLLTKAECCLPLPDNVSFIDGAFIACIASTAYSALKKLNPFGNETLAIFGLGPVGLTTLLLAKAMCIKVIGVEMNPERIDLAKKIGADEVINASKEDPVKILKCLNNGEGPKKILEASGNPDAQKNSAEAAALKGDIVMVGLSGAIGPAGKFKTNIDPHTIIAKELRLMGSYVMPINYYFELVEFIEAKKIKFDKLVTHRFSLEKAGEAFEIFDKGSTGKIIFEF